MPPRRILLASLALAPLVLGTAVRAAETKVFTPAAFEAAKASSKPLLVEVTAPWCPTCKAQRPILAELTADPKFKDLTILEVDFDTQKDVLRDLDVRMQSTLISYKGGREVARSTGDTSKPSIAQLLDKSL